jgi:predicted AlkP superfamily phosphohydrolase/phosphomutase
MRKEKRNILLIFILVTILSLYILLTGKGVNIPGQKIVVLGFDGIEPTLLEKWMEEDNLPNLKRIREEGSYAHLGTTNPAESPVAWASFATGTNPGKHSIFDFLRRDPKTYLPDLATTSFAEAEHFIRLGGKKFPLNKPRVRNNREGKPFWSIVSEYGLRTTIIQAPLTFPPDKVKGELLSGLGVPDIRGTWGTFSYYSTKLEREGDTEMGGKLIRVSIKDGEVETYIYGPRNKLLLKPEDILIPLHLKIDREKEEIIIELQGQKERIKRGEWSNWFTLKFNLNFYTKVHGICRFYLKEVSPELKLYLCPINFDPRRPPFPISYPENFSKELVKRVGLYKTLGWAVDTWALNEERIDEETFLEDLYYTMNKRAEITLDMLKKKRFSLFVSVFQATDRVQHMFWRFLDKRHPLYNEEEEKKYGNAILKCYQRMDEIVGEVLKYIDKDTVLIILSDHGFHSFRKAVNLNTWLVKNGFMSLETFAELADQNLANLFSQGLFWPNVNWAGTEAYALGLGGIYLNLAGREAQGIVSEGREYEEVRNRIIKGLKELKDPETGEKVIRNVYKREDIYSGPYFSQTPDLVVGFNDGYRVSWQTSLGGIPEKVIEENRKKWSGDHCSFDPEITKGILLINRKARIENPNIIDLAPTILRLFDLPVPENIDGKVLRITKD